MSSAASIPLDLGSAFRPPSRQNCILTQEWTYKDASDPIWLSLWLQSLPEGDIKHSFHQRLQERSPGEWKDLISKWQHKHTPWKDDTPCPFQPFQVVRHYLTPKEERKTIPLPESKRSETSYQVLSLLPWWGVFRAGDPVAFPVVDQYMENHVATDIFKDEFAIYLNKLGYPPIYGMTYAFAQYLLPLEKRLYDVLLPYCKDDDASRKSVPFVESLTKFSGLDPDEEDEDEEKKEKEARMRKQTTLFLKHLQEQGCSTRQINQVISEVFLQKGRTHCLFYSDLFRDQDRFYLHSKHGRIPVVIMDNHRNYVGHIYVYEHERLVCEMRGIRVGLTRAISKGCQHQRDQNVAQTLLASGVLPTCKRLGYANLRVNPVPGSVIAKLAKTKWDWNTAKAKSIADLQKLLAGKENFAPDISESLH